MESFIQSKRLRPQGFEDHVQEAGVGVQQAEHQQAHQHLGDEVGQEHHGLADLAEGLGLDFLEQDGHRDRQQIIQQDERQVEQDGVLRQRPQLAGLGHEVKVFQAHEGAAEDALAVVVVDERHIDARQRRVAERDEVDDRRHAHQNQRLGIEQLLRQRSFHRVRRRFSRIDGCHGPPPN